MSGEDSERADTRRNRREILDAALHLLMTREHATVEEVARAAGLTRATVYRHFPHRDALFRAAVADVAASVIPELLAQIHVLPLDQALEELARQVVAAAVGFAPLLRAPDMSLDEILDAAEPGDPIAAELAARRARREITGPLDDSWLATCVRAMIVASLRELVHRGTPAADVTANLARTLQRIVV